MPNITLALPEEVYRVVKVHREIRWSEIARRAIEEYARKLTLMDTLTAESELTEEDVMRVDEKVKEGILKYYVGKKGKKE